VKQAIHPGVFLGGAILLCTVWLLARPPVPAETFTRNGPRLAQVDPPSIVLDTAILERYAGQYEGRGDFTVNLTLQDGKLFAQTPGTVPFEMRATSATEFFLKGMAIDVKFDVDSRNTVRGFVASTEFGPIKLKRVR
jgi:hypothetical protein